jgi:phospholipid/cholesterol/gamma-HCH transport system substrate-binding protein
VPSQQEVRWSQLKVGVLVIVALSALVALIFLMSGSTGGMFRSRMTVRSYFENSAGLKLGAPVNLEGVTIGNVKSIRVVPERTPVPVEVTMKIGTKYASALHSDSKASLETIGVLGDTVVNISSKAAKGGPLTNGAELQTTETPNLSDVIKSSQGTIEQINTILAKLNNLVDTISSGKGSIGQMINNPDFYNKLVSTLTELNHVTQKISRGQGSIGKLVNDDALYNRANDAIARLQHITEDLDSGKGTAGRLLKDETLYQNLNSSVANANQLLADINAGKGGLGKLAKDPAFAQKLDDTVTHLDSLLKNMDEGRGTLGQLMVNPSLYNNSDQMLVETRSLVARIRENPKKYLTFHVKIF